LGPPLFERGNMSWPSATIFVVPENFSVSEQEFKQEFLKDYEEEDYNIELYKEATEWFEYLTGDSEGFVSYEDLKNPEIWGCVEAFLSKKCYQICSFTLEGCHEYPQVASISAKTIKEAFKSVCSSEEVFGLINRK